MTEAVELLGTGQYYNVDGRHPKGGSYRWDNHPCSHGPDALTPITKAQLDTFFTELVALLEMFGHEIVSEGKTGETKRKSLDDPSLHAASPELVLEALDVWKNELATHDDFVTALAAVKAALGPTREEFYGEVEAWALGYSGNDPAYVKKTWESIKDAALGADWLFGEARGAGFRGDAQQDFADDDQTANEEIPETAFDRMLSRYVWCSQLERYIDTRTNHVLTATAFNAACTDIAEFGKTGVHSAVAQFQNAAEARKASITTYRPGKGIWIDETTGTDHETGNPIVVKAVNQWRDGPLVPAKGIISDNLVQPWLDHVKTIFPQEDHAKHFLDWCAFKLQHRGVKINHALVLVGEVHGTGKDTVFMPVIHALGQHNVSIISPDVLASQWTHYVLAELIMVEEIHNFEKRATQDKLKPFIASPPRVVPVNIKNVRQYDVPNIQCWVFFTNHFNAIPIEDSDRRYWVHHVEIDEPAPREYFDRLYDWFEAGGYEKVAGWLLARDVTGFKPMAPPPMTEAKNDMICAGLRKQVHWAGDLLAEGSALHGRRMLRIHEDFMVRANAFEDGCEGVRTSDVEAALKRAGYRSAYKRGRLPGDKMPRTMWVAPGMPRDLEHAEMARFWLAETASKPEKNAA